MLSVQTEFLISLFLLLACALLAGEVALRLGQVGMVGQLIVGVLLGPTLLGPYIGLSTVSPQLSAIQFLATFFLLFMAGLELGPEQVYGMPLSTFLLGLCIFAVPFILTFAV
ncbi:MAG: cation:proton antiporter, partial [Thermoplasmata archaeon]|nr:cation:proton antiporter [Thermoplasmata archaeon]